LAAAHAGGRYTLRLWDLETGKVERELPGREGGITLTNVSVAYSPDGKTLAVGGDLWDLTTGAQLTGIEQKIGAKTSCWPEHIAFAPAGNILATGCFYGQLDLWYIPDGALTKSLHGYESWVNEMAFSPDSNQLAAIYNTPDFLVQVWQLPEGRPSFTLTGGHFTRVAYSPDGQMLATVMANPTYDQYGWPAGYVQLWGAAGGNMLARLAIDDAVSIAFSPDGLTFASGSYDGTLRLWAIESGDMLLESKAHYNQIQRLAFTPDGASLVSGSQDGTIIRWGIQPAK
jgi:WD40 repeat protein